MATGRQEVRLLVEGIPEEELCVQPRGWKPPRTAPRLCERTWEGVNVQNKHGVYEHKHVRGKSQMGLKILSSPAGSGQNRLLVLPTVLSTRGQIRE